MSRLAALAMRDLADCIDEQAHDCPHELARALLTALARAHEAAADRIEARARDGTERVAVPPEFAKGQAGSKKDLKR